MTPAEQEEFKSRLEKLHDRNLAFYSVYDDIPNLDLWFNQLLEKTKEEAEKLFLPVEEKDKEFAKDLELNSYKTKRQAEYAPLDPMKNEGLIEFHEGRPQKLKEYLVLRDNIKKKYPKPEEDPKPKGAKANLIAEKAKPKPVRNKRVTVGKKVKGK